MTKRRRKLRNNNRAWDTPTHVWVISTRLAGVVVMSVLVLVVHAVLQHHCKALNREIVKLESDQRKLTDDLKKERTRWSDMKTPANLILALHRHGIAMDHPSAQQVVYMESAPRTLRPRGEAVERPVYVSR
jgi:hypothetical protein